MSNLYTTEPEIIVLYSKPWCYDCKRARTVLAEMNAPFLDVDIEEDPVGREFIKKINNGFESVPTIIFPDSSRLVEPSNNELIEKLNKFLLIP
jgi:mycoredoxin